MSTINFESILKVVREFYLSSRQFNGVSAGSLFEMLESDWQEFYDSLCQLIEEELIGIIYADVHLNPHIIRIGFEDKKSQIDKLSIANLPQACVYPRPKHLETTVNRELYDGEPYKLCFALGEPHLAYRSFDLSVLEYYRNDPRYSYQNDDVRGKICYNSEGLRRSDRIFLQTFGFSYDEDLNRAVAVFLWYLSNLSSEHQLMWQAKELQGDFKLHPGYYRNAIVGDWDERVPICGALIKELYIINRMAEAMGRPPLFLKDFGEYGDQRPNMFGFLIRPTLEDFNNFVLLLDKMISDNINKEFFQKEVSYEREIQRKDGRIEVQNKGTLQILNEWVHKYFHTDDNWALWKKSMGSLRKIRNKRQKPAHAIDENIFDQRYFKEQRKLIIEAYSAINILRLLLENHPKVEAANIEVPTWLRDAKIWIQ